jgi:hypothetical protein
MRLSPILGTSDSPSMTGYATDANPSTSSRTSFIRVTILKTSQVPSTSLVGSCFLIYSQQASSRYFSPVYMTVLRTP